MILRRDKGKKGVGDYDTWQLVTVASYIEADVRSFPPPQLPQSLLSTFIGNSAFSFTCNLFEKAVQMFPQVP